MPKLRIFYFLQWLAIPLFDTSNQVFMKFLGLHIGQIPFGAEWVLRAVSSPYLWAAFASDTANFLVWMLILKRANLSFAMPFASICYITVLLSGWFLFHETIFFRQLAGISFIIIGVVLISLDNRQEAAIPLPPANIV